MRQSAKATLMGMTALAAGLLAGAVQAADASGAPSTVDEVVVTASKREEVLLKVPQSVSALTAQDMQKAGITNFTDLISHVPNVSVEDSGGGGVRPIVRGVTSFEGSPTVAIYIDDAAIQSQSGYQGTAAGGSPEVDLLDVERVEVLRGPQGTLYGGSSMGGAIKYVMKKPALSGDDMTVRAVGSLTDGGDPSGQFAATLGFAPVTDKVGIRISGSIRHEGGFIDQYDPASATVVNDNQDFQNVATGRVALRVDPTDKVSVLGSMLYQRTTIGGFHTFDSALGYPLMDNVLPEPGSDRFYLPSLTITAQLGQLQLTSATSYYDRVRRQDEDYSVVIPNAIPFLAGFDPILNHSDQSIHRFSQELRLSYDAPDGRMGFIAGVYYVRTTTSGHQVTTGSAGAPFNFTFFDETTTGYQREVAGFGEAYWRPIQPLKLTVGLRQSSLRNSFDRPAGIGPFADPPAAGLRNEKPLTPKFNVAYDINPDVLVYAQAAKGFRPGSAGGPLLSLCDAELQARGLGLTPGFDSDQLWTYEGGLKGSFADHRLAIVADGYHTTWTRKPEAVFLSSCGSTVTANVGNVDINGAEFESTFRPIPELTLTGNLGYANAKFNNSNAAAGFTAGDPVTFVPRWTASASAEYHFPVGAHDAFGRLDYIYRDKALQGSLLIANRSTETLYSDSYSLVNARLGVNVGPVEADLFVDNIANTHPDVSAFFWHPGTKDADRMTTVQPRTIGLELTWRH